MILQIGHLQIFDLFAKVFNSFSRINRIVFQFPDRFCSFAVLRNPFLFFVRKAIECVFVLAHPATRKRIGKAVQDFLPSGIVRRFPAVNLVPEFLILAFGVIHRRFELIPEVNDPSNVALVIYKFLPQFIKHRIHLKECRSLGFVFAHKPIIETSAIL